MFFSLVISSEVLKDVVQAEFVTSEECKICLIRTMQFQAKNMIMGNALTLDLEFFFEGILVLLPEKLTCFFLRTSYDPY